MAVSGAGEPVAHDVSRGDFDRGGAGVEGKRCRGAESADVADPGEDFAGEQVPDAV